MGTTISGLDRKGNAVHSHRVGTPRQQTHPSGPRLSIPWGGVEVSRHLEFSGSDDLARRLDREGSIGGIR